MKKTIGFLFLLLANFAILAHAFIPHHHHHEDVETICYLFSADNTHNSYHHDICGDDHEANGLGDDCILNGLYIRVASMHNTSPSDDGYPAYDEYVAGFPLICYNVDPSVALGNDGALPFRYQPFLLSSYNQSVTCSLGLRAPPVC